MQPTAKIPIGKYSEKEMADILRDVLDQSKVLLHCGKHNYIGSETPPPPIGCKNCWEAYWWHKICSTPPHLRQQRLEEAYRSVYDAVKLHERGEFDFEPYTHADIKITKEEN